MYRDYDIFEVLPNGSKVRIATVPRLAVALSRRERLAKDTSNECFVADHKKTRQIVAQRNLPAKSEGPSEFFRSPTTKTLAIKERK